MINIITKHTVQARKKHSSGLYKKTKIKVNSSQLPKYLKDFLFDKLNDILIGEPKELKKIQTEYYSIVKGKNKKRFNPKIRKIFNYDNFTSKKQEYNSYSLANNLKVNCCPNCNRLYTITVSSKKVKGQITRPDFDHYFPQSRYPILSLSFYNLIPSCKICNSTFKGSKPMNLAKHIHPYLDDVINDFSFDYKLSSKKLNKCEKISISYNNPESRDRIKNTLDLFEIEKTYNAHTFIVDQILELKNSLNDDYLEILTQHTYDIKNWSPEEAYRVGFGVNYGDEELYEHPFSKLKRDVLSKEEMLSVFEE
tara:strand:+ start:30223 stop:31149 length:927 start_codon:yes stop_codon:yes gene_type:complete